MIVFIAIGNGLHSDGTPSKMSAAIVDALMSLLQGYATEHQEVAVVFSGGYKVNGVTEAEAMERYYCKAEHTVNVPTYKENVSYRTHNNAIECLAYVKKLSNGRETTVIVVDHPAHIARTKLSFLAAKRLYFRGDELRLKGAVAEGVYDSKVPGQPYWADVALFAAHGRNSTRLYRFLLWKPWSRAGFWTLRFVWPSSKQKPEKEKYGKQSQRRS